MPWIEQYKPVGRIKVPEIGGTLRDYPDVFYFHWMWTVDQQGKCRLTEEARLWIKPKAKEQLPP